MTRWAGVGIGAAALAAAGLFAATTARASADDPPRKHVQVFRFHGAGARLGVELEDVRAEDLSRLHLSEERGALVKDVSRESAAEKAGLKEGDVILSYQGERVWSAAQLSRLVRETPPGRHVTLEVSRAGAVQRLSATLEGGRDEMALGDEDFHFDVPMPPMPPMPPVAPLLDERDGVRRYFFRDRSFEGRPGRLGLSYQNLSSQLARYFKVDEGALLVTDVDTDGPAARAGVKAGDVIVKVDGNAIKHPDDLRRAIEDAATGAEVTLTVQRDGRPLDLKVTLRGEGREHAPRPTT